METIRQFVVRVASLTGKSWMEIPVVGEENATRHILCRASWPSHTTLIVGMDDYPQQDNDGNPVFTQFGKVILK